MANPPKLTLAEARRQGKLDDFAQGREGDCPGNEAAFNRTLASMAGKSKPAPGTSKPGHSDD